jgi:hypothetical protein
MRGSMISLKEDRDSPLMMYLKNSRNSSQEAKEEVEEGGLNSSSRRAKTLW